MTENKALDYIRLGISSIRAIYGDFTGISVETTKRLPKILAVISAVFFVSVLMPIFFLQSLFVGEDIKSNDAFGNFVLESLSYKENWIDILAFIQTKRVVYNEDTPNIPEIAEVIKDNQVDKALPKDEKSRTEVMAMYKKNKEFLTALLNSYGGYNEYYDEIGLPSGLVCVKQEINPENGTYMLIGITKSGRKTIVYSANDVVSFNIDSKTYKIKIKYRKFGIKAFFPIHGDYSESFSDDFGGDRVNNGQLQGHEGIDIFADRNTPIVAIEDCIIQKIGWNGLGGWRILLESDDGNKIYYFAHMERYSDKLSKYKDMSGKVFQNPQETIKAGEIIGYVGSSGSFSSNTPPGADTGTPPHLHFQMWIRGGDWLSPNSTLINPFFSLKVLETNKFNQNYINNKQKLKQEGL